jgi:putative acetyltransferase
LKPLQKRSFLVEDSDPLGTDAALLLSEMRAEALSRYRDLLSASGPPPINEPLTPKSAFLIVRFDGHPIGCGALRSIEGETAEVRRMYVTPEFRLQGIGRWLLVELERRAARFGYKVLRVETGNRQPEAIALYESCGFQRIPPYGSHVNDPVSICFEKKVASDRDKRRAEHI